MNALVTGDDPCCCKTDIATVSYEEAQTYVKGYAYAMTMATFAAFFVHSREVRRKVYLLAYGAVVMLVTSDQKWDKKKLPDPDLIKGQAKNSSKRVCFFKATFPRSSSS